MPHIMDRRNELAGNLSLYQETYFIKKINEWVAQGSLSGIKHEVIELKWIEMLWDGEEQAQAFLNKERTGVVGERTG
jgi:hypothetical protein